jgi:hypothetical protein
VVSPNFTSSNIRNAALNNKGEAQGESPLDEAKLMSSQECAQHILTAIEKKEKKSCTNIIGQTNSVVKQIVPCINR